MLSGGFQASGFLPGSRNFARQRPISVRLHQTLPRRRGESPDPALKECPSGSHRVLPPSIDINARSSTCAAQEDSVKKLLLAGLLAMMGLAPKYTEEQNGDKILTKLSLGRRQPINP